MMKDIIQDTVDLINAISLRGYIDEKSTNFIDDVFIKSLDDWLLKNDKKYAIQIKNQIAKIPPMFRKVDGFLYRGMIVDEQFMKSVSSGTMIFKDITSWTKSKAIAKKFVLDAKYIIGNKNGKKVIFKKKFKPDNIIFDIYGYVLFSGGEGLDELNNDSAMHEEEVLIDSGIKIVSKDIDTIL
jgi:hypothetical protein